MPLVVTVCSNRKRVPAVVRAAQLQTGSIDAVGRKWLSWLAPLERTAAAKLYCGRNVRNAERAADVSKADLLFASAGLGWVRGDQAIPSYGMTVINGDDDVRARIDGSSSAKAWWTWINHHSPFATKLDEAISGTHGVVIVALPRPYLAMIEEELLALRAAHQARLRVIQRSGVQIEALQPFTLTYDDRLEGGDGHAGTLTDFSGRAAYHFAAHILPFDQQGDIAAHSYALATSLSAWQARPIRHGKRQSDEELREIIAAYWDRAGGRTSRLLRILRGELGMACEQSRFARLVAAMRVSGGEA